MTDWGSMDQNRNRAERRIREYNKSVWIIEKAPDHFDIIYRTLEISGLDAGCQNEEVIDYVYCAASGLEAAETIAKLLAADLRVGIKIERKIYTELDEHDFYAMGEVASMPLEIRFGGYTAIRKERGGKLLVTKEETLIPYYSEYAPCLIDAAKFVQNEVMKAIAMERRR